MNKQSELLREWKRNASSREREQRSLAERLLRRHLWLGVLAVVVTAIASSSLILKLTNNPNVLPWIGWLALIGALCGATNTFLNYGKLAESHRLAAESYHKIVLDIETILVSPEKSASQWKKIIERIRGEIITASNMAPIKVRGAVGGGGDDDDDDDDDFEDEDEDDNDVDPIVEAGNGRS